MVEVLQIFMFHRDIDGLDQIGRNTIFSLVGFHVILFIKSNNL
jgi:hypothetical protein